jgi:hypothetical protein
MSLRTSAEGRSSICGWNASGVQKSGARRSRSPKNSGGVTPTMVNAVPLRRTTVPIAAGSAPSRCRQKPWLTTVAGGLWIDRPHR